MDLTREQIKDLLDGFNERSKENKKLNVVLIGSTGVGKSTLINNFLGREICKIGAGKPCTQEFDSYKEHPYINIYDSKGMEKDIDIHGFMDNVLKFIKDKNYSTNPEEHIHIVLYCIGEINIQESDMEFIRRLEAENLHPIILFTKADTREDYELDNLKRTALEYGIKEENMIFTASPKSKFYNACSDDIKKGLSKLLERMLQIAPDAYKHAIEVAQNVDLDIKEKAILELREEAKSIVLKAVAAATAAGAIPIPGSDVFVITPIQLGMVGKLVALYGFDPLKCKEQMYPLIAAAIGPTIARQLLKFIPIAGSMIAAGVAASITGGIGYFCIDTFEKRAIAEIRNQPMPDIDFDDDTFKKYKDMFDKDDDK